MEPAFFLGVRHSASGRLGRFDRRARRAGHRAAGAGAGARDVGDHRASDLGLTGPHVAGAAWRLDRIAPRLMVRRERKRR
ncbi:hypothetical protein ACFOHS_11755 [Jhaorihella thermophila]